MHHLAEDPRVEWASADNAASLLDFGHHPALLFIEGVATDAFHAAHDPIPTAAARRRVGVSVREDPFTETRRPLVVTIASDCRGLRPDDLKDLIALSRLPGVIVVLAPGVPDLGFRETLRMDWTDRSPGGVTAILRGHPSLSTRGGPMRASGPLGWWRHRIGREASASFDTGLPELAAFLLKVSLADAEPLAIEASAHEAFGHDYIVSPLLAKRRRHDGRGWPASAGPCSPAEAMHLAGAKARMYPTIPLHVEPTSMLTTNIGMYLDLAVMNFVPGLRRALKAALAPKATHEESRSIEHLLAIRGRLAELLMARDHMYRLVRREALGPRQARRDGYELVGVTGNDLIALQSIHLTTALDSAFSVGDNLAWVLARRDGVPSNHPNVGFTGLVGAPRRSEAWREGAAVRMGGDALLGTSSRSASTRSLIGYGGTPQRSSVKHS